MVPCSFEISSQLATVKPNSNRHAESDRSSNHQCRPAIVTAWRQFVRFRKRTDKQCGRFGETDSLSRARFVKCSPICNGTGTIRIERCPPQEASIFLGRAWNITGERWNVLAFTPHNEIISADKAREGGEDSAEYTVLSLYCGKLGKAKTQRGTSEKDVGRDKRSAVPPGFTRSS
jgi:hypothetical protein